MIFGHAEAQVQAELKNTHFEKVVDVSISMYDNKNL